MAQWIGAKVDNGPEYLVQAGDRLIMTKLGMRICLDVLDTSQHQTLTMDVRLPFGIVNHEQVQLIALSSTACRVTFN